MRLILLTLSFVTISVIGYAQQPTNTIKPQIQSKTPTPTPTKPNEAPETTPETVKKAAEYAPIVTVEGKTLAEPTPPSPQNPPTDPQLDQSKPILVLINESAPDQIIVYDSAGKWLDNVKSVSIALDIGTGSIMASLTSWKGIMKPKNPKVLKVKVKELKSVTTEIFNDKLAELNK